MNQPTNNGKKETSSKLRRENTELKRQIKFLAEICRRCNPAGSTNMNMAYQSGMLSKQNICNNCDITYCQYSGMTKEKLAEQNSIGTANTPLPPEFMNMNGMNMGGGFGGPGGFMPF